MSDAKRFVCVRVLDDDGETFYPTHVRVVTEIDYDARAAEVAELRDVLLRGGFVQCDIAACNCGSWHQRYGWPERFHEIDAATEDEARNGETLLARVQRITAELATLKERLAELDGALRVALNQDGDHSPTCECRACRAEALRKLALEGAAWAALIKTYPPLAYIAEVEHACGITSSQPDAASKHVQYCQHDLQHPSPTIVVDTDGYGGRCTICGDSWRTRAADNGTEP